MKMFWMCRHCGRVVTVAAHGLCRNCWLRLMSQQRVQTTTDPKIKR